jgi:hypothetical protein
MRSILKIALVGASLFATFPAFAKTLTCKSQFTAITADISAMRLYSNVKAVDAQGNDLRASGLDFMDLAGPNNAYSINFEALDDTCVVNLPKKVLSISNFTTQLVCWNQNGKIVNGDGTATSGETLECRVD